MLFNKQVKGSPLKRIYAHSYHFVLSNFIPNMNLHKPRILESFRLNWIKSIFIEISTSNKKHLNNFIFIWFDGNLVSIFVSVYTQHESYSFGHIRLGHVLAKMNKTEKNFLSSHYQKCAQKPVKYLKWSFFPWKSWQLSVVNCLKGRIYCGKKFLQKIQKTKKQKQNNIKKYWSAKINSAKLNRNY